MQVVLPSAILHNGTSSTEISDNVEPHFKQGRKQPVNAV